ncbi:hypothetical protein GCM10014719_39870 [Planomonospora parontospora subsp. antibiotica]|nr:hypothetical protein GCM10014719_39870 [Planomonospora parontospora subsp. antibiotica]GII17203.1 hypothetical protein Ppa05_39290 [Planomonospora parontospora subsp. antibiotica]
MSRGEHETHERFGQHDITAVVSAQHELRMLGDRLEMGEQLAILMIGLDPDCVGENPGTGHDHLLRTYLK